MAGLLKKKWFFSSSGDLGRHQDKQPEVTDMYSIGKELGTGTFGVVRAVKSKVRHLHCLQGWAAG
jgi:hypothetical protein